MIRMVFGILFIISGLGPLVDPESVESGPIVGRVIGLILLLTGAVMTYFGRRDLVKKQLVGETALEMAKNGQPIDPHFISQKLKIPLFKVEKLLVDYSTQGLISFPLERSASSASSIPPSHCMQTNRARRPLHRNEAKLLYENAVQCFKSGKFDHALRHFESLHDAYPDHGDTAYGLASSLVRLNRRQEAVGVLETFLAKHPQEKRLRTLCDKLRVKLEEQTSVVKEDEGVNSITSTALSAPPSLPESRTKRPRVCGQPDASLGVASFGEYGGMVSIPVDWVWRLLDNETGLRDSQETEAETCSAFDWRKEILLSSPRGSESAVKLAGTAGLLDSPALLFWKLRGHAIRRTEENRTKLPLYKILLMAPLVYSFAVTRPA